MPQAECDPRRTWRAAAEWIGNRLSMRLGDAVRTEYIELYSPESFEHETVMDLLRSGKTPPFVTVDGEIVQIGGKLSERRILQELNRLEEGPVG